MVGYEDVNDTERLHRKSHQNEWRSNQGVCRPVFWHGPAKPFRESTAVGNLEAADLINPEGAGRLGRSAPYGRRRMIAPLSSTVPTIRAGFPKTSAWSGTSFVTTLPAPIMA